MEAQPRTRESGKEMDQLLIRPGIGYALTDHSTLWIGYAHVTNYPVAGDTIYENRMWAAISVVRTDTSRRLHQPNQAGTALAR